MKPVLNWQRNLFLLIFLWVGNTSWACSRILPSYYWDEWKNGKSQVLQSLLKQGVTTTTSDRLVLKVPKVSQPIVLVDQAEDYPEAAFLRQLLAISKWNAQMTNQAPFAITIGSLKIPMDNLRDFGLNVAIESLRKNITPNLFPFFDWCPMYHPSSWFTHQLNIPMINTHFVIFGNKNQEFQYDLIQSKNFHSDSKKLLYFRDFETFMSAAKTSDATVAILVRLTGNLGVLQRKFEVVKLAQIHSTGELTMRR